MDEMSIEEARPKLGDLVDRARLAGQSTVITRHGKPAAVVAPALTDRDRGIVADARRLAAADGAEGLRRYAAETPDSHDPPADLAMLYADAFGSARWLLGELAAIVERLDGRAAALVTEAGDD